MQRITETFYAEVTRVERKSKYLNGYGHPPTEFTAISAKSVTTGDDEGLRGVQFTLPGDLPVGTRFKVVIEQVDEVTAATIHRGALPEIKDSKLIKGGDGGVQ